MASRCLKIFFFVPINHFKEINSMLNQAYEEKEIHRMVYFGGVAPSIRKEVWPFLLGHYQFSMKEKCRQEVF